ncbi:xylose isomerase, partial [Lachnotalea glycerini]
SNIDDVNPTIEKIFHVLDAKIKVAHAKDCKRAENTGEKFGGGSAEHNSFRGAGAVELPAAGLGVLNYELYVEKLSKTHPNIPIIIEHLDESDIPRAKKFVDDTLKKMGV